MATWVTRLGSTVLLVLLVVLATRPVVDRWAGWNNSKFWARVTNRAL
ncbi:hypothetical protein [Pseudactinotalea sp. HY160]|nr:hypothetical protein [Pseudactinotalea sp. HY160]